MSLIATPEEFDSQASCFIHRYAQEFSLEAVVDAERWLAAARRALREERPDWVMWTADMEQADAIRETAQRLSLLCLSLNGDGSLSLGPETALSSPEAFESWQPPIPATPKRQSTAIGQEMLRPYLEVGDWSYFKLASSEEPEAALRQLLDSGSPLHLIEPVNLPLPEGGVTFRYGDYDNEFALGPASHDLRSLLASVVGEPCRWEVEVVAARSGAALGEDLENPDPCPPCFAIHLGGSPRRSWLDKFPLSGASHRIVVADSQNVAGSVLNHCLAINRHTPWQATALCSEQHPFIEYPQQECRVHFAAAGLTPDLRRTLEEAEVFLFFEDDDETSVAWPFDLRPFVEGKPVLHLYIGHRVHRHVVDGQRPGRTVLTPLPHLLRMFPQAHFYAGFPPSTLDDVRLRPPRSSQDGIVRLLHTPSLPHQTTHRYYYHKDTEAFLEAAQTLRPRYPKTEFWQLAGLSHSQILQARLDCDITFNQLRGYHGLSGDEAMYLERVMIQAFDQHNINRHREYWGLEVDFPWINARPGELVRSMEELLEDEPRRRDIGQRSRQFMLEYFSPRMGIVPLIHHCERALEKR